MVRNSHPVELAGRTIQMIDRLDLISMKLRAGRLKDDYDISQIVQTNQINEQQLQPLVTPEQFARFQELKNRK